MKLCYNSINAGGKGKDIKDFIIKTHREFENDYSFSLELISPTPVDENGVITDEWIEWRNNNWSTIGFESYNSTSVKNIESDSKFTWMDSRESVENLSDDSEMQLNTFFETIENPPRVIYDKIKEDYRDSTLEFNTMYYTPEKSTGLYNFTKGDVTKEENYVLEDSLESYENYYDFILNNGMECIDAVCDMLEWHDCIPETERNKYSDKIINATSKEVGAILYEFNNKVIEMQNGGEE